MREIAEAVFLSWQVLDFMTGYLDTSLPRILQDEEMREWESREADFMSS